MKNGGMAVVNFFHGLILFLVHLTFPRGSSSRLDSGNCRLSDRSLSNSSSSSGLGGLDVDSPEAQKKYEQLLQSFPTRPDSG